MYADKTTDSRRWKDYDGILQRNSIISVNQLKARRIVREAEEDQSKRYSPRHAAGSF